MTDASVPLSLFIRPCIGEWGAAVSRAKCPVKVCVQACRSPEGDDELHAAACASVSDHVDQLFLFRTFGDWLCNHFQQDAEVRVADCGSDSFLAGRELRASYPYSMAWTKGRSDGRLVKLPSVAVLHNLASAYSCLAADAVEGLTLGKAVAKSVRRLCDARKLAEGAREPHVALVSGLRRIQQRLVLARSRKDVDMALDKIELLIERTGHAAIVRQMSSVIAAFDRALAEQQLLKINERLLSVVLGRQNVPPHLSSGWLYPSTLNEVVAITPSLRVELHPFDPAPFFTYLN